MQTSGEKLHILAFGAHADDVEIGAAGTIIKHTIRGDKVAICDLTRAELSSNGDVETRKKEAERAAEIMGIVARYNLEFPDRGIRLHEEQLVACVSLIRRHQPDIILAPYWEDRHPDHEAASRLINEAVFNAGIRQYQKDLGPAHKTSKVYYYFINHHVPADIVIDVSDVYEQKKAALLAYRSQFLADSGAVETPLNRGFLDAIIARDRLYGQQSGVFFGEGFVCKQPLLSSFLSVNSVK